MIWLSHLFTSSLLFTFCSQIPTPQPSGYSTDIQGLFQASKLYIHWCLGLEYASLDFYMAAPSHESSLSSNISSFKRPLPISSLAVTLISPFLVSLSFINDYFIHLRLYFIHLFSCLLTASTSMYTACSKESCWTCSKQDSK